MSDYAYTMGVLRSLESRLLNATDIERMVDAPDAEAAFKVFNETDYADNILDVKPVDFNEALEADLVQIKKEYENMLPDKNLVAFLFSRYDFHNIKLSFKAKYSGESLEKYESSLGDVSSDRVRKYIVEDDTSVTIPEEFKIIIDRLKVDLEKNHEPNVIDSNVDMEIFSHLKKLATKIGNKFVADFLNLQIDLANIKILLRTKKMGRDLNFLKKELIEGGRIPVAEFISLFEADTKFILNSLAGFFDGKMKVVFDSYVKNESLWQLEQGFNSYEFDYLQITKRFNYGPELALAYYYAKENSIRNIRLIMIGKLNGVSAVEIRERIKQPW